VVAVKDDVQGTVAPAERASRVNRVSGSCSSFSGHGNAAEVANAPPAEGRPTLYLDERSSWAPIGDRPHRKQGRW
jgi:hypothetical protein